MSNTQPSGVPVAIVWWDGVGEKTESRGLYREERLLLGRDETCAVRIGHAPFYDDRVPRVWAELSIHVDTVMVANLHDVWPIQLLMEQDGVADESAPSMQVQPSQVGALARTTFTIRGLGPARTADGEPYDVHVATIPRARSAHEKVSTITSHVVPIKSKTQQEIGAAIVKLGSLRARRPAYTQIVAETNYAPRTVRENVGKLAAMMLAEGLVPFVEGDDALDRVAMALAEYPHLL